MGKTRRPHRELQIHREIQSLCCATAVKVAVGHDGGQGRRRDDRIFRLDDQLRPGRVLHAFSSLCVGMRWPEIRRAG